MDAVVARASPDEFENAGPWVDGAIPSKEALHGDVEAFVLYLNKDTFVGPMGKQLAEEVRCARANKMPILMLHENDPEHGGCAFDEFFITTPQQLIQAGLFKQLALALQPPPFQAASAALIARALGAVDLGGPSAIASLRGSTRRVRKMLSSSSLQLGSDHLGATSMDAYKAGEPKADQPSADGSEAGESKASESKADGSPPARSTLVASSVTITTSDDDSGDDRSTALQVSAARSTLRAAAVTLTTGDDVSGDDGSGLSPILNVSTRVTGKEVQPKSNDNLRI